VVVQKLIRSASELTQLNLTYTFASSDPKNGGMDCSGTIYHLLNVGGIKDTPRQSDEMCRWLMKHSVLHRTESAFSFSNTLFSAMQPGDLLFWSGTYDAGAQRDPPITHVMLYLGIRKKDGKPIVFGASDGRSYDGQRRCGVSVFDFVLPKKDGKATFYGYGSIPDEKQETVKRAIIPTKKAANQTEAKK
jgi:cell wall-associated NlpC family hydrolase